MCNICQGKKLLPFVKNGKVIPNAFVDCECKDSEPDYYREITPADFDFPCSDTFRGYYFQEYGNRDPGAMPIPGPLQPGTNGQVHPGESAINQRMGRFQGELLAIRDTLGDHIKIKKKQTQQKTQQTTDGIEL